MIKFTSYSLIILAFVFFASTDGFAQKMLDQSYYEDGSLKTTEYQLGSEYQKIEYHKNGIVKEKYHLSNNERNGKFLTLNEEGEVLTEIEYSQNTPSGTWIIRNKDGRVIATAKFENGKIKTASIWDESGNLIAHR